MGGLRRDGMPVAAFAEIARALARGRASVRARRFHHAGKGYVAYEDGAPALRPSTIVATASIVADGHIASADELAAALDALEGGRSQIRSGG
jgi:hypothetical protein